MLIGQVVPALQLQGLLCLHHILQLIEIPGIDSGDIIDFLGRYAPAQRLRNGKNALVALAVKQLDQLLIAIGRRIAEFQGIHAQLQRTHRFEEG